MSGKERSAGLRFVCGNMWKPYLRVVAKKFCTDTHDTESAGSPVRPVLVVQPSQSPHSVDTPIF